jgi:hypothetical protein
MRISVNPKHLAEKSSNRVFRPSFSTIRDTNRFLSCLTALAPIPNSLPISSPFNPSTRYSRSMASRRPSPFEYFISSKPRPVSPASKSRTCSLDCYRFNILYPVQPPAARPGTCLVLISRLGSIPAPGSKARPRKWRSSRWCISPGKQASEKDFQPG